MITPTPFSLQEYFDFWDAFVEHWKVNQNDITWNQSLSISPSNPLINIWNNECKFYFPSGIYGDKELTTPTINYLPEPYWGYTPQNRKDLDVVIINYNPGKGDENQLFKNVTLSKYSDYVTQEVLGYVNKLRVNQWGTSDWHWKNRGQKLAQSKGFNNLTLQNILSIELVPWHTATFINLGKYPKLNLCPSIYYSLNMAVAASKTIINVHFKNKVILRMNHTNFIPIAKQLNITPVSHITLNKEHSVKYHYQGVELILVWGETKRNDLPSGVFLINNI